MSFILILFLISLLFNSYGTTVYTRERRDIKEDNKESLKSLIKKYDFTKKNAKSEEWDVKDARERYYCVDLTIDFTSSYGNLWNCEEIKQFSISKENDFYCKNAYILVDLNLKHPKGNTTESKLVSLFLKKGYGEYKEEQRESECLFLKR
jgi:hypothetical protein